MDFAKQFAFDDVRNGNVQEQLLDIKNPFDFSNLEHVEELREIIKQLVIEGYSSSVMNFLNTSPSIFNGEKLIQNPTIEDFIEHYMWRLRNGSWRIIETDRVIDFVSKNMIPLESLKEVVQILLFSLMSRYISWDQVRIYKSSKNLLK